jgi:hypothetical protein
MPSVGLSPSGSVSKRQRHRRQPKADGPLDEPGSNECQRYGDEKFR